MHRETATLSRRKRFLVAGVVVGTLAGLVAWNALATAATAPTASEIVAGGVPTGAQLARELHLQLEPTRSPECGTYVETRESGEGYCLDGLGNSDVDLYVLGLALRGVEVSQEQLGTIEQTLEGGASAG